MNWFKSRIKIGKTISLHYELATNEVHARWQLSAIYGKTIAESAEIKDMGNPIFQAYKVQIEFRHRSEKHNMMAIEKEHVQSIIYKKFRQREIKQLIIHGKDEYG